MARFSPKCHINNSWTWVPRSIHTADLNISAPSKHSMMESSTSPLTWCLNACQDSIYLDEAVEEQRSSQYLRDRIRDLESGSDEASRGESRVAMSEARNIRNKSKKMVESFREMVVDAPFDTEFEFATSGLPYDETLDGSIRHQDSVTTMKKPAQRGALQKLVRKLGRLSLGSKRSSKERSRAVMERPHHLSKQCPECHGLRANYGKTRIEDLAHAAGNGCDICKLILDILLEYRDDLEPKARVRLLAPFQPGSTLVLWCQAEIGNMGKIPFALEVYVRSGTPSPSPSIAEASDITGDTSSALAISKARAWIEQCEHHHSRCIQNKRVPLPTRLVRISETASGHFLRLVETGGQYGRYACLSHPWGKTPESVFTTTDENYKDNLNNIPFESLSRVFQHAIMAAWRLGFNFIWIDSLCIIQRNARDWKVQASKMEACYRQADLTLAASRAFGPDHGCYVLADPEYLGRAIDWSDNSGRRYTICARRAIPHGGTWPLLSRGWVYQERILSPRVLHFAEQELVWECAQVSICECSQSMNFNSELSGKLDHHRLFAGEPAAADLRSRWRDIVQEYSNLDLTYHKDTLPALAGLAEQMHRVRRSRYLAGLWEDSLVGDMLWFTRETDHGYVKPKPRPDRPVAPTWSWASFEPVEPGKSVGKSRISYDAVGSTTSAAGFERCQDRIRIEHAVVLAAEDGLSDADPDQFDQRVMGEIILEAPVALGWVQTVPWVTPREDDDEWRRNYCKEHEGEQKTQLKMTEFETVVERDALPFDDRDKFLEFNPDYSLHLPGWGYIENNTIVKVVKMATADGVMIYKPGTEVVVCLVLREVTTASGMQKHERIGLATYVPSRSKVNWFADAEIMRLEII